MIQKTMQSGFTLVELMVVVAIVGIATTAATVSNGPDANVESIARNLAAAVGEASAKAVNSAPVNAAAIVAEGTDARARLVIGELNGAQYFAVEQRVDVDADSTAWEQISLSWVPLNVSIEGVEIGVARLAPGGGPTPFSGDFELECDTDGSCATATLFLQDTDGENQYRIAVMPLAAAPAVLDRW